MSLAASMFAPDLTREVLVDLGIGWMLLAIANCVWATRSGIRGEEVSFGKAKIPTAAIWSVWASMLLMIAFAYLAAFGPPEQFFLQMPTGLGDAIDSLLSPWSIFVLTIIKFVVLIALFRWWTKPDVAWVILNLSIVAGLVYCSDVDFRSRMLSPGHLPVALASLGLAFVLWAYFRRASIQPEAPARAPASHPFWPDKCLIGLAGLMITFLFLTAFAWWAPLEIGPASPQVAEEPIASPPWFLAGFDERARWGGGWFSTLIAVLVFGTVIALPWLDNSAKPNEVRFENRKAWVIGGLFLVLVIGLGCISIGTLFGDRTSDAVKLFGR